MKSNTKNITFEKVRVTGGFWAQKQQLIRDVAAMNVYNRFDETGRIKAFTCDWVEGMPDTPHIFWDSDVAKWIESVAYITRLEKAPELEALADAVIDNVEKNQHEDGYFNIYYTVVKPGERFTNRNNHELYCAGHLVEAAIAYKEATGKDKLYNCMLRYVDLIERIFVKEQSAAFVTPGHEELELALVRLYDHSGEKRYLDLAKFFVDMRGNNAKDAENIAAHTKNFFRKPEYFQDQLPIREQTTAEGHAVRLCYLYTAVADVAYRTGDKALADACEKVFENIISKRMYVTGGIGSTPTGEMFEADYMLDNAVSYTETCAALSLALFAHRMQLLDRDSRYGDTVERVIYNGFISGISLDGKGYFYENPLRIDLEARKRAMDHRFKIDYPISERVAVFHCSCCPPNITRFIPSISNLVYTLDGGTLCVNQFMDSEGEFDGIRIRQKTNYPFDGRVETTYGGEARALAFRVPYWCKNFTVTKNGESVDAEVVKGYFEVAAEDGDVIVYDMEMKPALNYANSKITATAGRAALSCGPMIYCLEAVDNKEIYEKANNLDAARVIKGGDLEMGFDAELKLPVIIADGRYIVPSDSLYSSDEPVETPVKLKFIPYHAFANRGESEMQVWVFLGT